MEGPLMLSHWCIIIDYMIQNQIRVDTSLIYGIEAIFTSVYQNSIMFTSFFMSDQFERCNMFNVDIYKVTSGL